MKINKGFVVRKVGNDFVAVPIGEMSKTFHGMINLNETGRFLWDFFTVEHTMAEGVAALRGEYDVSEEIAQRDVERFLSILVENGFAEK